MPKLLAGSQMQSKEIPQLEVACGVEINTSASIKKVTSKRTADQLAGGGDGSKGSALGLGKVGTVRGKGEGADGNETLLCNPSHTLCSS